MKLWSWQKGRQRLTEYYKFPLWFFRIGNYGFDAYILKYEANTTLHWHKDPIEDAEHYRLNIRLSGYDTFIWKDLVTNDKRANSRQTLIHFRPDITWHKVETHTKVTKLSFGFVKFKK